MTKSDFIKAQNSLINFTHEHNLAVDNFIKVMEGALSGLANMCPDTAIQVIQDLQTKVEDIKTLKKQKDKSDDDFVKNGVKLMPDFLNFEEEQYDTSEDN